MSWWQVLSTVLLLGMSCAVEPLSRGTAPRLLFLTLLCVLLVAADSGGHNYLAVLYFMHTSVAAV